MIDHLDHLVLTTCDLQVETFGAGRLALRYGNQKINLHVRSKEFELKPTCSCALDLCFIASVSLDQVIARLQQSQWPIFEGPVQRTGATWPILSVYIRDPDLNLIEISQPL